MALDASCLWRVRGAIRLNTGVDRAALLGRVERGLRDAGCDVAAAEPLRLLLGSGGGRYGAFAFIDGGEVWLDEAGVRLFLRYDLPTLGGLRLCCGLSVLAGGLAWYAFDDPALTAFGFAAPLAWLYGANFAMASGRVPGRLRAFCAGSP